MSEKLLSDFIHSTNALVLSQFPTSDLDAGGAYLPSLQSYHSAVLEWDKARADIVLKYWNDWNSHLPNEYNSDHMTLFLYLLSRAEAQVGRFESADRISYLNKIRNGVDVWHTVSLPTRTVFVHSIGTVLGRAKYGTSLICYQNVTVGGSKGHYPEFQGSCLLYSNVSVLGNSNIGTNVIIGAGTLLVDKDIPDSSTVFGRGNELVIRPNSKDLNREFFKTHT
jgi:serine O-acetyltransferase